MFLTADTKHIVVPYQTDLAQVIPHALSLVHQGQRMLVIPNRPDEVKVARNLGVDIPVSVLTKYDWLGKKPWDVQKHTTALLTENPRAFVLNEFGTGKTRSVIWAANFLGLSPILVAAPLSTLSPVWEAELFRLLPATRVILVHGTKKQRLQRLAEPADWYIINHHGLDLMLEVLMDKKFQLVVIDELAVLRNRRTLYWQAANQLINRVTDPPKFAWGLTGSPTPKAATDAWAQIKLLMPGNTTRTFKRFRDLTMQQVSQFRWVKRQGATQLIHDQMQPAVRYTLSDVMELPPITYRSQKVPLDPDTDKAYRLMINKLRLITNNGETITAVNEGVLQSKLLQVACGFIYTDKRGTYRLPVEHRLQALLDIVQSTNRKFIVFVPFLHALDGVAEFLQNHDEEIAVIHGQVPVGQRNKTFLAFQNPDAELRGIVAHPACMSHGLTLTQANTVIWYSPVNNYETYEQANARVHRPGQTSKTLIAHLIGTPVEQLVYRRLRDRGNFQGLLLELFHLDNQ